MAKKKSLTEGFLDLTVGAALARPALGIIGEADIPAPLKTGTQSLIGVVLVKGAADLIEDKKKKRGLL